MPRRPIPRALAGVALSVLALGPLPLRAQTPASPAPVPSVAAPAPAAPTPARTTATPAPLPGATAAPGTSPSPLGTPRSSTTPIPSGTAPPGNPGAPSGTAPSGGTGALRAIPLPTLAPADQASPLPYPAYGTPAPTSPPATAPGIPQVVTLEQAVLIAYARAPQLAAARAAVDIASAPVVSAGGAILPNVSGSASTTRNHRQPGQQTVNGNGQVTQVANPVVNSTSNSLSLSLRQLIYDGGRVAALLHQARALQQSSIDTYQRQLQTVAFNVSTAYYNVLSAERQVQVNLETVQLDIVQENLVSAQIRAGTAARADLSTAQLPTAQARVAVVRAQSTAQQQLAAFANVLGLDANVNVQPKDDVPALSATSGQLTVTPSFPTPSYDQAVARAYALRPDLASSQQTIAAYEAALRAARLGLFPTLNGVGSYQTASTDPAGGTFRNNSSIGLQLSVPVFDQGLTRANVLQALGQVENARAQFQISQQGVQLNVKQALTTLISAYAALTQTNAELAKAQEVLRSTQAQYRAGVTTLPLLLNAQVGLTTALTDEVTSVYAVRQAEQALLYAEGANAAG